MPSARLRSRPSANVVMSSESAAGASAAPPSPCSARKETREAAAEQQGAAEDDGVGRDDPLKACLRKAQIGLDRGQGGVHDRHIENHHELCGDDESQGAPASPWENRLTRGNQAAPPIVDNVNYTRGERL